MCLLSCSFLLRHALHGQRLDNSHVLLPLQSLMGQKWREERNFCESRNPSPPLPPLLASPPPLLASPPTEPTCLGTHCGRLCPFRTHALHSSALTAICVEQPQHGRCVCPAGCVRAGIAACCFMLWALLYRFYGLMIHYVELKDRVKKVGPLRLFPSSALPP